MAEDTKYQAFFRKQLAKAGYNNPEDIPKDKKDDFFNKIDRMWKGEKETDESLSRAAFLAGRLDLIGERQNDQGEADSTIS